MDLKTKTNKQNPTMNNSNNTTANDAILDLDHLNDNDVNVDILSETENSNLNLDNANVEKFRQEMQSVNGEDLSEALVLNDLEKRESGDSLSQEGEKLDETQELDLDNVNDLNLKDLNIKEIEQVNGNGEETLANLDENSEKIQHRAQDQLDSEKAISNNNFEENILTNDTDDLFEDEIISAEDLEKLKKAMNDLENENIELPEHLIEENLSLANLEEKIKKEKEERKVNVNNNVENIQSDKEKDDDDDEIVLDLDKEKLEDEKLKENKKEDKHLEKIDINVLKQKAKENIEKKKIATIQNIPKTETIYERQKKNKSFLSKEKNDKNRTFNPIEEIANLTFEEWYRLGDIPAERIAKIKEKIESIGERSIVDQVKALKAWRQSKIMQEYLDLGIEALKNEDKGLVDVIKDIKDKHLTVEEWLAINKLNRDLML